VDTATGLKHIARIGFDCVDVHTEAVGISQKEVSLVAKTCDKLNLPVISLPVCSLGLADFAAPVREFHIERTKKFIDLARTWRAKNVLLVLGEYIWQREVIPAEAQWQWALETAGLSVITRIKRKSTSRSNLNPSTSACSTVLIRWCARG